MKQKRPDPGTPRTDAACVSREFIAREMDSYAHKFVLADFARELERENARLREALERIRAYKQEWHLLADEALRDTEAK